MIKNFFLACCVLVLSVFAYCTPVQACTTKCGVTVPKGDLVTHGTIKKPLDLWVEVCYPDVDWQSQQQRTGQVPFYVSLAVDGQNGVLRGIPRFQTYEDMADAKLEKVQCYKQHYQPGWVIMTVTQCERPGFYSFLSTKVLSANDNKKRVYFEKRPEFAGYAYPVR